MSDDLDMTSDEKDFLLSKSAPDEFTETLSQIKALLRDNSGLTPDLRLLYTDAINCLTMETSPIAEEAGIKRLTVILKPLGVTVKAIRKEIKDARRLINGDSGHKVTNHAQGPSGQGFTGVTDAETPDPEEVTKLQNESASILSAADPVPLIEKQIRSLGYGGDIKPPLIVYLAFTSRLLKMRTGGMAVHLLLHGPASAGKSYTLKIVSLLFPREAYHIIDAASPRVLIYDPAPLNHRVLVFAEADSLPAGEDNPAASAIRNLAQDGFLHYEVVEKNDVGTYYVREIVKDGPTVLITTAVRRLGHQLMTRLFTLDVADDAKQVRAALATQAELETNTPGEVDPALIAFQALLQAQAPWHVVVPFAFPLATEIGRSAEAPRILRDFQRILSLIKSVAVLRHQQRRQDDQGRLVAEIDDYRAVYDLVGEMYASTTAGAGKTVREIVDLVTELKEGNPDLRITFSVLAKHLKIDRSIARRRANQALGLGWLVNNEARKRHTADLAIGDEMPPEAGLPSPDVICDILKKTGHGESHKHEETESLDNTGFEGVKDVVCDRVTRDTEDINSAYAYEGVL